MKVGGVCYICHKPTTHLYTCFKCGKKVCSEHYTSKGLCVKCSRKQGKSELVIPESAKPVGVKPGDIKK